MDGTTSRGGCPSCGKTIPFLKATIRRGRPFPCAECGRKLLIPKVPIGVMLGAFALGSYLARQIALWGVLVLIVGALVLDWLFAQVRLADEPTAPPGA